MPVSKKGQFVLDFIARHPKVQDRALARMIYDSPKGKEVFKDTEDARSLIRYYKGKSGDRARKRLTVRDFFEDKPKPKSNNWGFIPEPHTDEPAHWYLPKSIKKVLLISDIHIPYHSVESLKLALNHGKKEGVDCIYINGDLVDFFPISFHEKDKRKRPSLSQELEMCRQFLKGLREMFPKAIIYFKPANHEHRLERYLVVKAPELLDCDEFKLDVLLRLREMKIEYIPRRSKTYFGHLLVEHGDRMKGSGGVNPARSLYLKYKRHVICGHFHRKSENSSKIYDGKLISTFSVGSLCELEPEYYEVNDHVNGFAVVEMNDDEFHVKNYTIENGKVF
jgi:predicted phosphodiesterase